MRTHDGTCGRCGKPVPMDQGACVYCMARWDNHVTRAGAILTAVCLPLWLLGLPFSLAPMPGPLFGVPMLASGLGASWYALARMRRCGWQR